MKYSIQYSHKFKAVIHYLQIRTATIVIAESSCSWKLNNGSNWKERLQRVRRKVQHGRPTTSCEFVYFAVYIDNYVICAVTFRQFCSSDTTYSTI